MAELPSKIVLKKTADGKTKKVLVRRVKKTIRLKKPVPKGSSPSAARSGQGAGAGADRTKVPYGTGTRSNSAYSKTSSHSPSARNKPRSSAPRGNRPNFRAMADTPHAGVPLKNMLSQDQGGEPISEKSKKKSKIYITKKDATKRSSSFERASSKRKFKRSTIRMPSEGGQEHDELGKHRDAFVKSEDISVYANVPKKIEIGEVISIVELSRKLNLKASQLIKKFFSLGVMNLRVSDSIDADSAQIVCNELGCKVEVVSLLEQTKVDVEKGKPEDYVSRPAILTIMGHVDHGKTTLLSALTKQKMEVESGGITQHVAAYSINRPKQNLVFIDTPGHSAFFSMRAKGIKITDFLILIISLSEGIKPQTLEVLSLAKTSDIPMIIVITMIDKVPNPAERETPLREIKNALAEKDVALEEWGGKVPLYMLSAQTGEGIEEFIENLETLAIQQDLKGNPKVPGYGYILESQLSRGEGNVATIIVKNGTMRTGDTYLCHKAYGRVRAIFDETGKKIPSAEPGNIVRIIGLSGSIPSGKFFQIMENEREARQTSAKRYELEQMTAASNVKKHTTSNLFSAIQKESIKELRLIVKSDTYGSAEAIRESLKQLKNDEVKTEIIHFGVGSINENDVQLAVTAAAEVIAFKLKTHQRIKAMAEQENVQISHFDVIYEIIERVKEQLTGMLGEDVEETKEASIVIKEIFKISTIGKVAGCEILEGKVKADHQVRIFRDDATIFTGSVASLRRFKDSVQEVAAGNECGLTFKNFDNFQVGDTLETFSTKVTKRTLKIEEKVFSAS